MKHYDLIIIGAGSANIVAHAARRAGKSVAVIEKHKFGGTCLNRGCIPTKVLATVAEKRLDISHAHELGIKVDGESISLDQDFIKKRVFARINKSANIPAGLRRSGMDVFEGSARFVNNFTVDVSFKEDAEIPEGVELLDTKEQTRELAAQQASQRASKQAAHSTKQAQAAPQRIARISADKILIATGAKTNLPKLEGLAEAGYLSSERFFSDEYPCPFPRSIVILGGGYIGCEFASIFSAFGTKVHVLQSAPVPLRVMDEDLGHELLHQFEERGINFITQARAQRVTLREDGQKEVHYSCVIDNTQETANQHESSQKDLCVVADEIFVATGVRPNTDELGLENTDLKLDKRGWIMTNEAMETSVPGIYCIGDANGQIQLRHKANREAHILSNNLFAKRDDAWQFLRMDYSRIPSVVFSVPELANVGMTERAAKKNYGTDGVEIYLHPYGETAKGYAMGFSAQDPQAAHRAFVKLVVKKDTKAILGVHVLGPQASLLMQSYSYLLNLAEHNIVELNKDEISASNELKEARKLSLKNPKEQLDDLHILDQLVTAHPSLAEVIAWSGREENLRRDC